MLSLCRRPVVLALVLVRFLVRVAVAIVVKHAQNVRPVLLCIVSFMYMAADEPKPKRTRGKWNELCRERTGGETRGGGADLFYISGNTRA